MGVDGGRGGEMGVGGVRGGEVGVGGGRGGEVGVGVRGRSGCNWWEGERVCAGRGR